MAVAERIPKVVNPPNLRFGNARKRCGGCRFFGRCECLLYGTAARPTQLCDSYQKGMKG